MTGLPRAQDTSRPRDCFEVVLVLGIERLTTSLRKGDPFTEKGLREMQTLAMRLDAFKAALDERLKHKEGME